MQAPRRWSHRTAIFSGLLMAALHGFSEVPTVASAEPTDAELRQWADDLSARDFAVREAATERLRTAGLPAVPALATLAKSSSPEAAVRATEILAVLYQTLDFPAAVVVEDTIEQLREVPGSVGQRAARAWTVNAPARTQRTVAQIEAKGALVRYRGPDGEAFVGDVKDGRPIQFIVISRKWTGGDDGLKLLARLSNLSEIQIYHVNGAQVSPKAMEELETLGYRVERRGAFLGISNGGQTFPQRPGCEVGRVTANSPADKAGLRTGDFITAFGEDEVLNFEQLVEKLKKAEPGDKVTFSIERDGAILQVPVELSNW